MARKYEAAKYLKDGLTLLEIAARMGISVASVSGYLYSMAGEGVIRRSDIVFAIPQERRQVIEACFALSQEPEMWRIEKALNQGGFEVDRAEIETNLTLRDSRISRGDKYEFVSDIERILHNGIQRFLVREHSERWWLDGIPEPIRVACAGRREVDRHHAKNVYCYTMFIDLKEIIDKNWKLFGRVIPAELASDKPGFMKTLQTLNEIRNRVMHPIKALEFTEGEFSVVRRIRQQIAPNLWRALATAPPAQ